MSLFYSAGRIASNQVSNMDAHQARQMARDASQRAEFLELDVERLLMIAESLWNILQEKFGYAEDELLRRVVEIDIRDGRLDNRVAATPPVNCPHCGRVMAKRRPLCLFCGKPSKADLFQR